MNKLKNIFIILFIFLPILLFSKSINGIILEYGNREPISYVRITLVNNIKQEEELETYSNKNGKFSFKNLESDNYTLIIDDIDNFKGKKINIILDKVKEVEKKIFLEKTNNPIYTLNINKRKNRKDITKKNITKYELKKIAGVNGNFIEAIKKLPGVARNSSINSYGIIIRGTGSLNSRIFIDGHYIPMLYHFAGITPIFNSELIKNIDFYPGNYPLNYGKAIGGVVNLTIRDAKTKKYEKNTHGYLDINFNDTSLLLEYPINKKSGLAITFRKSLIDKSYPLIIKNNDIARRLPTYYDWQLRYNYRFSRKNKISFTHFGSDDNYKFINSNSSKILNYDDYSAKSFLIVNIFDWLFKINKNIISKSSVSFQYNNRFFKIGEFVKITTKPYLAILKEDLNFKLSKLLKLNLGFENWVSKVYSKVELPSSAVDEYNEGVLVKRDTKIYLLEREYYLSSLYAKFRINLKNFNANIGLRIEYTSYNNSLSYDPRFTVNYCFSKKISMKSGIGIFHQPPFEYQSDKLIGNPNLNNQYSIQYTLGIEYDDHNLTTTFDIFYNNQRNLIIQSNKIDKYNNNGEGKAYGMEILVKYKSMNKFFGWISYTLMKALYRKSKTTEWNLFDYDQTHILNIVASYKLFRTVNVSLSLRYTTGSPETPILGSIFDSDKNEYIPIYDSKNSKRLKDFFQIDFKIGKEFIFKYWKMNLYLDIQNITNYKNEEGKAYNYDYSNYVLIEAIPFFPYLGIKGEF